MIRESFFVNKEISENIAIKIEGNKVEVEKIIIYRKPVSEPNLPFLFSFKILYVW